MALQMNFLKDISRLTWGVKITVKSSIFFVYPLDVEELSNWMDKLRLKFKVSTQKFEQRSAKQLGKKWRRP